jgi:hypothetical protein
MAEFKLILGLPLKEIADFTSSTDTLKITVFDRTIDQKELLDPKKSPFRAYVNSESPESFTTKVVNSVFGLEVDSLNLDAIEGSCSQEFEIERLQESIDKAKVEFKKKGIPRDRLSIYKILKT